MEAAEGVFGGEFDHLAEDDVQMAGPSGVKTGGKKTVQYHQRLAVL
jgi:hypothetical protein